MCGCEPERIHGTRAKHSLRSNFRCSHFTRHVVHVALHCNAFEPHAPFLVSVLCPQCSQATFCSRVCMCGCACNTAGGNAAWTGGVYGLHAIQGARCHLDCVHRVSAAHSVLRHGVRMMSIPRIDCTNVASRSTSGSSCPVCARTLVSINSLCHAAQHIKTAFLT
jgi:hypothetical protein